MKSKELESSITVQKKFPVTEVVCVRNVEIFVRWAILHWIHQFAKVNVKNIFYGIIILILVASCSFRCTLSLH